MFKKAKEIIHIPKWLFVLLLVVLVFRIPTLFEPYAYGDEMIYLTLGEAIRRRIPLYAGIHDNKPPLLYIMAAIGGSVFGFRAILMIWHLVTVFVFWKLAALLFPAKSNKNKKNKNNNNRLQIVATVLFAILTTIPLLEGNIPNSEVFMIGPTILAFIFLLSKKVNSKKILAAGFLFSISTLFKMPAAFDVPAIIFYWLATTKFTKKNIFKISKDTVILSVGFAIPILLTFIYYYFRGALTEYFIAAFGQNVGYLSSFRPDDAQEPFLVKNGPLLIRAGIVVVSFFTIFLFRKKLSKQYILLAAWLILTVFAVTLSERPYPHYLIQSVPALSILVAMLFTLESLEQPLVIFPITIFLVAPAYFNFWRYPVLPYYGRFVMFATRKIDKETYYSSFGGNVVVDYKVSDYLRKSSKPNDPVFVWGDNATIYALSRRLPPLKYVADYHISDFSSPIETIEKLNKNKPEFVILLPNAKAFPKLDIFVNRNYILTKEIDDVRIYKLLNPKVRALIAP